MVIISEIGIKLKKPDRYQYTLDSDTKRTQKEERGEYQRKEDNTKYKGESSKSTEVSVKKEDKGPEKKTFKKKKVASLFKKDAVHTENAASERELGKGIARQRSSSDNSALGSPRAFWRRF